MKISGVDGVTGLTYSRQMIDNCPSCMKPWREAFFAQAQEATGDITKTIKDFVVTAFHKAQRDALWKNSGTRLDTWHVSDFVSPCLYHNTKFHLTYRLCVRLRPITTHNIWVAGIRIPERIPLSQTSCALHRSSC